VHLHSLSLQGVQGEALRGLASGAVEAEGLSTATVPVLRFAQHAARNPAGLAEADFDALGVAGLSAEEVLEVIGTVQACTAVNAFTDMVDLEIDPI
jgi:alkylhydroperoxidase family enzyme